MKIILLRKHLLKAMQNLERIPNSKIAEILNHILIEVHQDDVTLTATNLEIELNTTIPLQESTEEGVFTLHAKKLSNICKTLTDEEAKIRIETYDNHATISFNTSKFTLSILPATSFHRFPIWHPEIEFHFPRNVLLSLIQATQFTMGKQDPRGIISSMKFSGEGATINVVTTDGHRLAIANERLNNPVNPFDFLLPEKSVAELNKILDKTDDDVHIAINKQNIKLEFDNIIFSSKLIDGQFPDYKNSPVIPQTFPNSAKIHLEDLRETLHRSMVLNDQLVCKGIFHFTENLLTISTKNSLGELTQENLQIEYDQQNIDLSLNIKYVLQALDALSKKYEYIYFLFINGAYSTAVVGELLPQNQHIKYIIAPVR